MILEIDAGNTRLKWRLAGAAGPPDPAVEGSIPLARGAASPGTLLEELNAIPDENIQRIRVASVRGKEFNDAFRAMAGDKWQLEPEFAVVEKQCSGVTNSYDDVQSMGVDRWLAMLAAYHRAGGACCVLDCGSAITFDWIDAGGRHRGGYIVPGLELMRASLAGKAPSLAVAPEERDIPGPGCSTRAAISRGILAMVTGFARQCREQVDESGPGVHWFLTGGDAGRMAEHLDWPVDVAKDLVLDGLALSLP